MDMPLPNLFYFTAIPMLLHQIFQINHLYGKTIVKLFVTYKKTLAEEKKKQYEQVNSYLSSIEYGEISEHVENVQEALAFYDYYEGDIDGIYGTMTETALQKAEQDNALPERIQTEQQTASNEE